MVALGLPGEEAGTSTTTEGASGTAPAALSPESPAKRLPGAMPRRIRWPALGVVPVLVAILAATTLVWLRA
jgi:hypothetical protein